MRKRKRKKWVYPKDWTFRRYGALGEIMARERKRKRKQKRKKMKHIHLYKSTWQGWVCARCGKPKVPFYSERKRGINK